MMNSSLQFVNVNDNATTLSTSYVYTYSQPDAQNMSVPDGCIKIVVNEKDYVPWDNPDNIVSVEVENISHRTKDFVIAFLFLIGGPANVINMAVFYKQGLKDRVNLCLFALSFADEVFVVTALIHNVEQLYVQFTTKESFGPVITFLSNNHVVSCRSFCFVSFVLSAIIASERCLCVVSPFTAHTLLRTRTMAVIILVVFIVVFALYFIVSFRFQIGCAYNPLTGAVMNTVIIGEFYQTHKKLIDHLDSFVFGAGLPGVMTIVVTVMTIITTVRLRQVVKWRTKTSSSISSREVVLTKMLIGSSVLFIACVFPIALTRFSRLFMPGMNSGGRHQNFFLTTLWLSEVLTVVNSAFNFFIYYVMGSRYRETFWALFGRKLKPEKA